jgi:hypothetical protein
MTAIARNIRRSLPVVATGAALLLAWSPLSAQAEDVKVMLSGSQEVPPVTSSGSGSGTISIGADKTVTGSVTTTGVTGTMAHIHDGAAGKNGPVVVPLSKSGENTWAVPPGVKLTDALQGVQSRRPVRQRPQRSAPGRRDPRPVEALERCERRERCCRR